LEESGERDRNSHSAGDTREDAEYRVVCQRPSLSFGGWCILIVAVATVILLRFMWPAVLMAFVLVGVTSPSAMLGVIGVLVILGAASLHAKLNGR